MEAKTMRTYSKYQYIEAAQLFHWATKEQFVIWFTGERNRHKRTEVMLPRLERMGKLTSAWYRKKKVYAVKRRNRNRLYGQLYYPNFEHGIGCTEGLVRFWRSDRNGYIIPEMHFRGFGSVPEWGILYPNGKLLLFEFCTEDNFKRYREVKSKIARYRKNLHLIEEKFKGEAVVLFVADVKREKLDSFIWQHKPFGEEFFFTDYQTFLNEPIGHQLTASIYIWGENGWPYPLRGEDHGLEIH